MADPNDAPPHFFLFFFSTFSLQFRFFPSLCRWPIFTTPPSPQLFFPSFWFVLFFIVTGPFSFRRPQSRDMLTGQWICFYFLTSPGVWLASLTPRVVSKIVSSFSSPSREDNRFSWSGGTTFCMRHFDPVFRHRPTPAQLWSVLSTAHPLLNLSSTLFFGIALSKR